MVVRRPEMVLTFLLSLSSVEEGEKVRSDEERKRGGSGGLLVGDRAGKTYEGASMPASNGGDV